MIRQDWLDAFYLGLESWPGDKNANDCWYAYLAWDTIPI